MPSITESLISSRFWAILSAILLLTMDSVQCQTTTTDADNIISDGECATSSFITKNVTIAYASIYGLLLLAVSIYSFCFLMQYSSKFQSASWSKKLKMWIIDSWMRKNCYIPILTHLFDQITDVSVAMQFLDLALTKSANDWEDCNGLNMWYLFGITVASMLIYRVISSFLIYRSSGSVKRLLFQLADVELYRALYINYLCNNTSPCQPQRWITAMEATLESSYVYIHSYIPIM